MHVLFVVRSYVHFGYYGSVLDALMRRGHQCTLLFDEKTSKKNDIRGTNRAFKTFLQGYPHVKYERMLYRSGKGAKLTHDLRELRTYVSNLNRTEQSEYYRKRWAKYLPTDLRNALQRFPMLNHVLALPFVQPFLEKYEEKLQPDPEILKWLQDNKPDIVVATPANMQHTKEIEYIKAAKHLGIPTVIVTFSWDNISTKAQFYVHPDKLIVWNDFHKQDAIRFHKFNPEDIKISGSYFFDKWFAVDQNDLRDRKEFLQEVGLNPEHPYLLYLGSSKNIATDETWLFQEILKALESSEHPELRNTSILVRPHQQNASIYQKFHEDPELMASFKEKLAIWPAYGEPSDIPESQQNFVNSVKHSIGVVGINTSAFIDAMCLNKPIFSVLVPQYQATQTGSLHFRYLQESRALETVSSCQELARALEGHVESHNADAECRRKEFIERFIRPNGIERPAGECAADFIEGVALSVSNSPVTETFLPEVKQQVSAR